MWPISSSVSGHQTWAQKKKSTIWPKLVSVSLEPNAHGQTVAVEVCLRICSVKPRLCPWWENMTYKLKSCGETESIKPLAHQVENDRNNERSCVCMCAHVSVHVYAWVVRQDSPLPGDCIALLIPDFQRCSHPSTTPFHTPLLEVGL